MNKKYIIYKHTNKINGKIYIGQTCQKPEYRWNHGEGYKGSPRFYSAIQSYGQDNFEHEILYKNLTFEEANQKEIELINFYKSNELQFGYNLDSGGKGQKQVSDETKLKQSMSAMNRPIVTDETKKKLSKIGKDLKRTEETKQKLSDASLKREEEKRQLGIKRERPVICLNTQQVFPSCRTAANWCGLVGTSGIASVCKGGKQKTAGVHPETKEKLRWAYYNE